MYEKQLKQLNPSIPHITYDITVSTTLTGSPNAFPKSINCCQSLITSL